MRRPHIFERSAPRFRREPYQEPRPDPGAVARGIGRQLPDLAAGAAAAGLTTLAGLLDAARIEADRLGRLDRAPPA